VKILHIVPYFYPAWSYGGTPRVVYELSRHLVQLGHEVLVFTTDVLDKNHRMGELNKNIEGMEVFYFPNISNRLAFKNKIFYSPQLRKHLNKLNPIPEIIHLHEYRTFLNITSFFYARENNIPYALSAHGSLPSRLGKAFIKNIFDILIGKKIVKHASMLVALSELEKEQYESYGIGAERISILYNGIDLESFSASPPSGSFKKKYEFKDRKLILFLGRLNRIKGLDFLVKSFALLSQKRQDVLLLIAGEDDGYRDELVRMIIELRLQDRIHLIGLLKDEEKLAALRDADFLVYPSKYEIFGLVPLEAIMCGAPVILSRECGCAQILENAGAALTVSYGDIQSLTDSMEKLLDSKQMRISMVEKGQRLIQKKFSWDDIARETLAIYQNIINKESNTFMEQHMTIIH
jgi:glycosyltransferase involved in cell wall biosynthesis